MGVNAKMPIGLVVVTTTERNGLTVADGDLIYNSTLNEVQVRANGTWKPVLMARVVTIQVTDFATNLTTGDGKFIWRVPAVLNGWSVVAVAAHVTTVSSSGAVNVQLHNLTDAVDILSTALTIDQSEKDSSTAATAAVINTSNDEVATADEIRVDIDGAGTGARGLSVELTFLP